MNQITFTSLHPSEQQFILAMARAIARLCGQSETSLTVRSHFVPKRVLSRMVCECLHKPLAQQLNSVIAAIQFGRRSDRKIILQCSNLQVRESVGKQVGSECINAGGSIETSGKNTIKLSLECLTQQAITKTKQVFVVRFLLLPTHDIASKNIQSSVQLAKLLSVQSDISTQRVINFYRKVFSQAIRNSLIAQLQDVKNNCKKYISTFESYTANYKATQIQATKEIDRFINSSREQLLKHQQELVVARIEGQRVRQLIQPLQHFLQINLPILHRFQAAIRNIRRQQIMQARSYSRPPPAMQKIVFTLYSVIKQDKAKNNSRFLQQMNAIYQFTTRRQYSIQSMVIKNRKYLQIVKSFQPDERGPLIASIYSKFSEMLMSIKQVNQNCSTEVLVLMQLRKHQFNPSIQRVSQIETAIKNLQAKIALTVETKVKACQTMERFQSFNKDKTPDITLAKVTKLKNQTDQILEQHQLLTDLFSRQILRQTFNKPDMFLEQVRTFLGSASNLIAQLEQMIKN